MKKSALYVRVNGTKQTTALESAEAQLEELWKFAEAQGYKVVKQYYEICSGIAHVHGRTIWHMLEDAENKKFDTVIVQDIGRISRKSEDALFVINALESLGIELVSKRGEAAILA